MGYLRAAAKKAVPIVIATTGFNSDATGGDQTTGSPRADSSFGQHELGRERARLFLAKPPDARRRLRCRDYRSPPSLQKDAPSGTALALGRSVARALNRDLDKVGINGRKGIVGERSKKEIALLSVRAGDIVGEHTVIFGGIGERLEFIHRAHSRDTFARGAIRAAQWLAKQKPGLYGMQDVLGFDIVDVHYLERKRGVVRSNQARFLTPRPSSITLKCICDQLRRSNGRHGQDRVAVQAARVYFSVE